MNGSDSPREVALEGGMTPAQAAFLHEHQETFAHFLAALLLVVVQIAQTIALLTVAFAVGAGWWSGLASFVAIGAVAGLAFQRGAIFWALEGVEWVVLALGGVAIEFALRG